VNPAVRIPFVDLTIPYREVQVELEAAALRVLRSCWYVLGPEVESFEAAFAQACDVPHCVGTSSGTSALQIALAAHGIGPGDEVVTTPFTFIATAEAIRAVGATPVFADVDPRTWNLDPARAEAAITPRTKAVLPVHLHGRPADLPAFESLCRRHGLLLVEDAAQAHLARSKGRLCGSVGHSACFSFYPGKNLGAAGEGGAVTTHDPHLARRLRMLREFGSERKYEHELPRGTNARLESLQAAILSVKLAKLAEWTDRRRKLSDRYRELLAGLPLVLPAPEGEDFHVWHVFAVLVENRPLVQARLADKGIQTSAHYPKPLHLQPAFADLGHAPGDFPVAEDLARRVLSLPFYVGLDETSQQEVANALRGALA
jgi:dTDP-4-amino-4,6-dideoxygalactose transaminase